MNTIPYDSKPAKGATRTLTISLFRSNRDKYPKVQRFNWEDLKLLLSQHRQTQDKDSLKGWSPVEYDAGATRNKDSVKSVHCLVFDFDKGVGPESFKNSWKQYEFLAHSTYSHCGGFPKWRAIFPLTEPVPGAEWQRVYFNLGHALGKGIFDGSCQDSCRLYYVPACPVERHEQAFVWKNQGAWINALEFPDIDAKQKQELKKALSSDRNGQPMPFTGKVDFLAIATGQIPKGNRHWALIRAIKLARMEDRDKEAIQIIIESFHRHIEDFGERSYAQSLAYYMQEIDNTWAKFQPDPKFVRTKIEEFQVVPSA